MLRPHLLHRAKEQRHRRRHLHRRGSKATEATQRTAGRGSNTMRPVAGFGHRLQPTEEARRAVGGTQQPLRPAVQKRPHLGRQRGKLRLHPAAKPVQRTDQRTVRALGATGKGGNLHQRLGGQFFKIGTRAGIVDVFHAGKIWGLSGRFNPPRSGNGTVLFDRPPDPFPGAGAQR